MQKTHLRTPLLVDVDMPFDDYLKGLTRPAKKNYRASQKKGYLFSTDSFDHYIIASAMHMWSEQIGGKWVFGPEYFDQLNLKGWLKIFKGGEREMPTAALLPMERFGDFMYAQPVLYNKETHPNIAKFMWYEMIKYSCTHPLIKWIDLGGGFHGSWKDFLMNRADPKFAYKWQFVSKAVKIRPQYQPPYYVQRCSCGWKQLVFARVPCKACGN